MSQTLYQVLGVPPSATLADIKHAYKELALRYHPDRHGGSLVHEDQFKQIAAAYRVLSHAERRAAYDYQLYQARRRAEEQQRARAYRPQAERVYGVPMPPPEPLRTRPPASAAERHYVRRPPARFNRRDWLLVLAVVFGAVLFGLAVRWYLVRSTVSENYRAGLEAYANGRWSSAQALFGDVLLLNAEHIGALRRRAEISQFVYHRYSAARADYTTALLATSTRDPRQAADLLYRIGQCDAAQGRPRVAVQSFSRALALDTTLSGAWLARGEVLLFEQRRFRRAINDLSVGLRQRSKEQSPSVKWLTYRGLAYFKMGDYRNAVADYQQVLLMRPSSGQIHFLLGRVAQQQGRKRAACEFFRRGSLLGYPPAILAKRRSGCGG